MQRKSVGRAIAMCALIGAVAPVTALAQTAPPMTTPAQAAPSMAPTDPATIIPLLPGPMGSVLAADLRQIQGSQSQADIANATQIFEQTLGADLSTAETNLQNDSSMSQGSSNVTGDQQLISDLLALNTAVMAMEQPMSGAESQ